MSRIVTNASALTVYKDYSQNNKALTGALGKLASGLAINTAADDPSGLAISEDMRLAIGGTNQAIANISNASNFLNTADGYLQTVNDMLGRMEELAVEYGQGTNSANDQTDLAAEFNDLYTQIAAYSNASFNGKQVFGGATFTFQVGANAADTFTTASMSLMTTLLTGVSTSATGITSTVTQLQTATDAVATLRGALGGNIGQLSYLSTAEQNYSVNISSSESSIRDVDVAQESTTYAKEQILVQSSTAMLAQANAVPQNVLTLLK
jgi:flagellin